MNLVLIDERELAPDGTARVTGRRAAHVLGVLGAGPGDRILAGVIGGRIGEAAVLQARPDEVILAPRLDREPPPPSPISLLVALPRPKILRRVIQAAASMGVKRIVLLGSWRVEKSYWSSPLLAPDALREQLLLGLEQGRDTVVPEVQAARYFKPFVEDRLEVTFAGSQRLLAHPCESRLDGLRPDADRVVIAIGPEGGWTPYETRELEKRRFAPFSLGPRTLRVDTAVPFAVGAVAHWLVPGTVFGNVVPGTEGGARERHVPGIEGCGPEGRYRVGALAPGTEGAEGRHRTVVPGTEGAEGAEGGTQEKAGPNSGPVSAGRTED